MEDPALPEAPPRPFWGATDLVAFASFFIVTLLFLPLAFTAIAGLFRPGITVSDLPGEIQILIQAMLDLVWVGFIFFLIKKIHRRSIRESLHWFRARQFHTVRLIAFGVGLAVTGVILTSLYPAATQTPIEKLIETPRAMFVLAIFGVVFAPFLEEIMFRGFFFAVLDDLGGAWLAVPCTAILFALLHAPQLWGSVAGIVLIFLLGFVLSLTRNHFNSLIPSIIIHIAYNGALVAASVVGTLVQSKL